MTVGDRRTRDEQSDRAFERTLLASARADELPYAAMPAAWSRFAERLASPAGSSAVDAQSLRLRRARGASYWLAAKWLMVGAIAGSALTFAWLRSAPAPKSMVPVAPPRAAAPDAPRDATPSGPLPTLAPPTLNEAALPSTATRAASDRKRSTRAERRLTPRSTVAESQPAPNEVSSPSTLSEEVRLLDAARMESSRRDYAATLRWIDEYRRQFPRGELSADAEVVAIEASVARGDRSEADACASRFLRRYPNDPHTRYIQRLIERE